MVTPAPGSGKLAGMTNELTEKMNETGGPQRRARRTRAEVEAQVAAFRASGQTVAAYARGSGVPEASLRAWLAWRARRERQQVQASGAFAPVRVVRRPTEAAPGFGEGAGSGAAIWLRWPSGVEARIGDGVDPAWAAAVLRAVEGACSR